MHDTQTPLGSAKNKLNFAMELHKLLYQKNRYAKNIKICSDTKKKWCQKSIKNVQGRAETWQNRNRSTLLK